MAEKILRHENKVKRHGFSVIFAHWTIALSSFVLIFSGIGMMPVYRRYNLVNVPGFSWSDNFVINSQIHYVAAVFLVLAAAYHIFYHARQKQFDIIPKKGDLKASLLIVKAMLGFGKEPPSEKYLAEQRLAYLFIGGNLLILIVTGFIKVIKNYNIPVNYDFMLWVTMVHNVAMVFLMLGIFGHLAAFIFKENRALLPAMFTAKVDLDYVKHRHSLWYEKLLAEEKTQKKKQGKKKKK